MQAAGMKGETLWMNGVKAEMSGESHGLGLTIKTLKT